MSNMHKKRIDRYFVDRARDRLADLANSEPTKGISRKDTITELSDDLRRVIERHGIEAAVAALNSDGIEFPIATVTTYLHQIAQMADIQAKTSGKSVAGDRKTELTRDDERARTQTKAAPASSNKTPVKPKSKGAHPDEKQRNNISRKDGADRKINSPQNLDELISRKGTFDIKPDSDDL